MQSVRRGQKCHVGMYVDCAGGMPDLLLWHPEQRRAKASEVKGPRDRLSEQQRAWATALSAGGMDVEVWTLLCSLLVPWQSHLCRMKTAKTLKIA